jgi:pimeloyl-ACP methyl ester carboxylesterase
MLVTFDDSTAFIDTGGREFALGLPTRVFIHGAQHDHFVWKALVNRCVGPRCNVVAPDLPGHGRCGGAPLPTIEAMADWLVGLLKKLGAPQGLPSVADGTAPLTLIGHSMGSLVALEAATRWPGQVGQLVMIGTALPMPVAPALLDAAREAPAKAMSLINQWSHSPAAWRGGQRGMHGVWLPAINLRIMERQPPATLFNDLTACNDYRSGLDALARIACPVTLVAGSADRMTSVKAARKLAARLPAAQLVEIPDVGHALMAEAPEAVARALPGVLNPSA